MKASQLWLVALACRHSAGHAVAPSFQETSSTTSATSTMTGIPMHHHPTSEPEPEAEPTTPTRSYPITITSTLNSTTRTTAGLTTVDHITVVEPWPLSPDPELMPYTLLQTGITTRTISDAKTTTVTSLANPSTWIIWEPGFADMPTYRAGSCGEKCTPGSIKPDYRCRNSTPALETRCARQCELRIDDMQWWCYKQTTADVAAREAPMGRVCWGNSTNYLQTLEPCDHTDFGTQCSPACPEGQDEMGEPYPVAEDEGTG